MYVPAIPEKQLIGDKDSGFIEERRQLLERFIRECAKYDYLIESKEFKIFTQTTQGEVTKQLEDLPKLGPAQILEKYKIEFSQVKYQDFDKSEIATLREKVSIFRQFLAKCQASNTQSRNAMMNCVKEHAQAAKNYQTFYTQMMQFEHAAVNYFTEGAADELTLTHSKAEALSSHIAESVAQFKNPFLEAALWIRGEMLDIAGMINSFKASDEVVAELRENEREKISETEELAKLRVGKATLKSFFKSAAEKEKDIKRLEKSLVQCDKEIEEYKQLIDFITIVQGRLAIDKFKRDKHRQYQRMLHLMSVRSVSNAHLSAELAARILDLQAQK